MKTRTRVAPETISLIIFLALTGVLIITFSQLQEGFLTIRNIRMLFRHMSINAITALGLTFVIVVGHFDMSFHMIGCLAAMTTSFIVGTDVMMDSAMIGGIHALVIPAVILGVLVGAAWGVVSGVAVGVFKLNDMVTTIGTGSIGFGLAYLYSNGSFIYDNFLTSGILAINDAEWIGIPFPVLLMVILYLTGYFLLHRSGHGRRFYATGANKIAAIFSGVQVKTYIISAFVICAGLTSLAAIITTSAQGVGNVKASLNFLMPAYAALYIGIAIFKKATVVGTFLGSLFTTIMYNGFTLMAVPFYFSDLIIAVALIMAIVLSRFDWTAIRGKTPKTLASSTVKVTP
ncbi:MAG: ABC transporter permease [bacterium]|nr:ABC transporter permease [bacterium]